MERLEFGNEEDGWNNFRKIISEVAHCFSSNGGALLRQHL